LLGYPALVGKFLINPRSDQYLAGYAFREFAAQSLKSGHGFPQWNPYLQGGMPYIAAMHGDIFYPTFLLRWVLPTDVAMTWEFIIHLFLAGFFTYFFLRAWGFGFWGALVGGLAYMLGGSIAGFASPGHDGKLFVSALTPAGLLLITRAVRDGRAWAWGVFSLVVGLAFLSPHPQLFQYFLLLSGSFALYIAFANHPELGTLPRPVAFRRLGLALGCVVLGCLMGAVQYLPALVEYKPWSPRAAGHDWAAATAYSYPIEETLNWYWPQFSGILDNYWGRNGIHLHSDYFGVVVLILAGAAFGRSERGSYRRFWLVTAVVSLIWAFGGYTPLYHVIMLVPYTKYLRAPSTMIFVTALSISVLAAMGMERVLARRVSTRYVVGWVVAAGVLGLFMSAGGYTTLARGIAAMFATAEYPPELRDRALEAYVQQKIDPNRAAAVAGVWRSFLFVALTAGLLWAFFTDRIKVRPAIYAIVALLVVDLWSIERQYWIFSPRASVLFATDGAIDAIKADIAKTGQPARVLNLPIGQGLAMELGRRDRTFTGDKLMVHGIRIPGGYHGNELGMYQQLLSLQIDSQAVELNPRFWRHENVQYWYADADDTTMAQVAAQLKVPRFLHLAGPVKNASGSTVHAYKVSGDNPVAWVAAAIVKAPPDQALATVLDARFNPATVAIVDTSAKDVSAIQIQTLPAPATLRASVPNFKPAAIDVTLDQPASAGQALVVSENYYPGWHAMADGKPAPVARTNYNLLGIPLPAGARNIQLRFTDAAYERGKVVTLIVLAVVALLIALGVIIERRSTASLSAAA